MKKRVTLHLPGDLLACAKRRAAAEGHPLTSLIEDGLRLMLAGARKVSPRQRVLPRVSTAVGGIMPGIDLTAHQEIDDLDDLARLKPQS